MLPRYFELLIGLGVVLVIAGAFFAIFQALFRRLGMLGGTAASRAAGAGGTHRRRSGPNTTADRASKKNLHCANDKCMHPIVPGARFCPHCGHRVDLDTAGTGDGGSP